MSLIYTYIYIYIYLSVYVRVFLLCHVDVIVFLRKPHSSLAKCFISSRLLDKEKKCVTGDRKRQKRGTDS